MRVNFPVILATHLESSTFAAWVASARGAMRLARPRRGRAARVSKAIIILLAAQGGNEHVMH